jgi:hypothetical protein
MPHPQFTIRTLLWLMLAAATFFAGLRFERERRRREDEAAALAAKRAQGMPQGSAPRRIKKGPFEFSYNSEGERRYILEQLDLGEESSAPQAARLVTQG